MTKTEFQAACKLLNGFEIEEGNYYKLSNGEVVLINKLSENILRYRSWLKDDINIIGYDEFMEYIKPIQMSTVSDFTFVTHPFLDQITKRYQHENYTWLLEAVGLKNNNDDQTGI